MARDTINMEFLHNALMLIITQSLGLHKKTQHRVDYGLVNPKLTTCTRLLSTRRQSRRRDVLTSSPEDVGRTSSPGLRKWTHALWRYTPWMKEIRTLATGIKSLLIGENGDKATWLDCCAGVPRKQRSKGKNIFLFNSMVRTQL